MISLEDKRKELYQWDTNRYINLGDEIADATKVHFGNGVFERSIDVPIEDKKALIPDVLLQYARPLKVWLFVGEASNGYTKVEHIFQVKARNKPSDYVFTPTEQLSLQELINKFEDFREGIGEEVEDYLKNNPISIEEKDPTVPAWAKNAKKPSYTAAEVGARSDSWLPTLDEIGAQPKGDYALKSEIPAISDAPVKSVNGKTGEVKLTAKDVGALEENADLVTPEEVEDAIDKYMQEHPAIVTETDPTVPGWAKQSEKPKYTPEEIGAQPKGDYALKSQIPAVPVQSVNGQTGAVELSAADVGALPKDTPIPSPYTLPTASASTKGGVKVGNDFRMDGEHLGINPEFVYSLVDRLTVPFEETAQTVKCHPVSGCPLEAISHIEPVQDGSGVPAYDNIRQISGWTGAVLRHTGKNLLDQDALIYNGNTNVWYSANIQLAPNTVYVVSNDMTYTASVYAPFHAFNSAGGVEDYSSKVYRENPVRVTTLDDGIVTIRWNNTSAAYDMLWYNYQIELGETATDYEPYAGLTEYTAKFGQTIYGGGHNWTTGTLVNRFHKIVFDGVTIGAKVDSTDPGATTYAYVWWDNLKKPMKTGAKAYANKLESVGTTMVLAFGLPAELTGVTSTDDVNTVVSKYNAVLKQWYDDGTPLEIVYETATPEETKFSPQQILSLSGANVLWSNCGQTTVNGPTSPKETGKRIAALEAAIANMA